MKNHLDGAHKAQLPRIPNAREGYDDPDIDCVGMEGAPSWFTQELIDKYGGPELQTLTDASRPPVEVPAAAVTADPVAPAGLGEGMPMAPLPPAPHLHAPLGAAPPHPQGYGAQAGYPLPAYGGGGGYPGQLGFPPPPPPHMLHQFPGGRMPPPPHPGMIPYGFPRMPHHPGMASGYPGPMPLPHGGAPRPAPPGSLAAMPGIAFLPAASSASTSAHASAIPASSAAASVGPSASNGYGSALAPPASALAGFDGGEPAGLLSPNSALPPPHAPAPAEGDGAATAKLRLVYDDEDLSPEERRAMLPRYKRGA